MKDRRGSSLESSEETSGGLGGEGDFRHQDQGGPTGREDLRDEAEVDLRLSTSRDSKEQVAGESFTDGGPDRFHRGGLMSVEVHHSIGESGCGLRPCFDRGDMIQLEEAEFGQPLDDRGTPDSRSFREFDRGDRK